MNKLTKEDIGKRIDLLEDFLRNLEELLIKGGDPSNEERLRRRVNRLLVPTKEAVNRAGVEIPLCHLEGQVYAGNYDPFDNLFQGIASTAIAKAVIDCVDRAIGFYQLIQQDPSMDFSNPMEGMEIRAAIKRALRTHFIENEPSEEKKVQDAVEAILTTIGVSYTREKETSPVGEKAFKPDFVVEGEGMAIEVKLAKGGHGAPKIQEEISADIHGYRQRWPRVLFVIYDLGTIRDPEKIRDDNEKTLGVFVEIVKH